MCAYSLLARREPRYCQRSFVFTGLWHRTRSQMHRPALLAAFLVLACASAPVSSADTSTSAGTATSTDAMTSGDPTTSPNSDPATDPASDSDPAATSPSTSDTDVEPTGDTSGDPPIPRDAIAVAVGYGTRRVRSQDGLAWTDFVEVDPNGGDDDNLLRGVGYGDGMFVAVGGAGAALTLRSLDGSAWESIANDLGNFVSDVAWQDGTFVAAGGNGLRARPLDAGGSWQDAAPSYSGHFRAIAAGDGIFVAVGHTYGDSMIGLSSTSTDGATWTTETTFGAPMGGGSIAFGDGVFVARDGSGAIRTSTAGTWGEPVAQQQGEGRVIRAGGVFITSGTDGFFSSTDGAQWEPIGGGDGRGVVAWLDGRYLSLGWPLSIDASEDLQSWQNAFAMDGPGLTDIAVGSPGQ